MENGPKLPLEGVKVLDLSRVLAGPYATMVLGDLGADVLKVEHPERGDDTRHWGPPFAGGESAYFLSINRNKRSIGVDLKDPDGLERVEKLAAGADVVIENWRRGALEKLGLGYEKLKRANPDLVYCSITGFGPGPDEDRPGYDFLVQARGGVMGITGQPGGEPTKVGVAISDIVCGLFASNAILAALYRRSVTGEGARIEVPLFESTLGWLANRGQEYLVERRGHRPHRQRPPLHRSLPDLRCLGQTPRRGRRQQHPVRQPVRGHRPSRAGRGRTVRDQPRPRGQQRGP